MAFCLKLHATKAKFSKNTFERDVFFSLDVILTTYHLKGQCTLPFGTIRIDEALTRIWKNAALIVFQIDSSQLKNETVSYNLIMAPNTYYNFKQVASVNEFGGQAAPPQFFARFAVELQIFNDFYGSQMRLPCIKAIRGLEKRGAWATHAIFVKTPSCNFFKAVSSSLGEAAASNAPASSTLVKFGGHLYLRFRSHRHDSHGYAMELTFVGDVAQFTEIEVQETSATFSDFFDTCFHCGAYSTTLQLCAGCMRAKYCSRACQRANRPHHMSACNVITCGK
jgi:hypothetical protein